MYSGPEEPFGSFVDPTWPSLRLKMRGKLKGKKIAKFELSRQIFSKFSATKCENWSVFVGFEPKRTSGAIFTKIRVYGRTGPYIRIRKFLMDGLLMFSVRENIFITSVIHFCDKNSH